MFSHLRTQKQLKEHIRKVINGIGVCSSIKTEHPQHWELFIFLFKRHPNYPDGFDGLRDIMVQYNPVFRNNLEVLIKKVNGEVDTVSVFNKCITGKPQKEIYSAMRTTVLPQILRFKNSSELICTICSSSENPQADHFGHQFAELAHDFIENKWKGDAPKEFEQDESHCRTFKECDGKFENEWYNYHKTNARLRILCAKCNGSIPKSRRYKCAKA